MSNRYVSASEVGRLARVSRAAVSQEIKKGRLPTVMLNGKSRLDIEDLVIQEYINRDRGDRPAPLPKQSKPPETSQETAYPQPLPAHPQKPRIVNSPAPTDDKPVDGLKTQLEREKLEKLRLSNQEARRELVPVEFFKRVLSEYFQIDQGQTLQLEYTLAARICQEVFEEVMRKLAGEDSREKRLKIITEEERAARVKAVAHIINKETYTIQKHKKRLITEKLKEIGEEL